MTLQLITEAIAHPTKTKLLSLTFIIFILLSPCITRASSPPISNEAASATIKNAHVAARLISSVSTISPNTPFAVGIQLKIDPGWHVYWRYPGEAGLPVTVKWHLPEGFKASSLMWPIPNKENISGLISYVYSDEVILPLTIYPPPTLGSGRTITLEAQLDWLACKESCIPGSAVLKLSLPVADSGHKSKWSDMISAAINNLPQPGHPMTATLEKDAVTLSFKPPSGSTSAVFYPYAKDMIDEKASQKFIRLSQDAGQLKLIPSSHALHSIKGLIVFTVTPNTLANHPSEVIAYEVNTDLQKPASLPDQSASIPTANQGSLTLGLALVFAFVGGLILNLMPCVFPVLSIKVLSLIEQAKEENSNPLKHAIVFTSGVLASFWVVAGLLLLLRSWGAKLGWGFQLQSPLFVSAMALLFLTIALNLFGLFEVGESLQNLAESEPKAGYMSTFLSGALATLVATPCTAPFMGSAIGFTLSAPTMHSFLIFTFLGLGMAFPYVLLTNIPVLVDKLPRPGAWMVSFKQFMAFPMLLTCVWLIWVLGKQTNIDQVVSLLAAMVFMALGWWIYGRWGNNPVTQSNSHLAKALSLAILAGSIWWGLSITPSEVQGDLQWHSYTPQLLQQLRRENKPVFLDFTAAWCLSCQVNEKIALQNPKVKKRFKELGVVLIKADWTDKNPTITKALEEFGRNGVPLYVFYPPGGAPVVLPEVITPGIVLKTLNDSMQ